MICKADRTNGKIKLVYKEQAGYVLGKGAVGDFKRCNTIGS